MSHHHDWTTTGSSSLRNLTFGPGGGATIAGFLEIFIFHPADTIAKRLICNEHRVVEGSIASTLRNVHRVVFDGAAVGTVGHVAHLYPGSQYAMLYKISQRFIKFAGQPYAKDHLETRHGELFVSTFGSKLGKLSLEAVAGSCVGMIEVGLLPIDRMKVVSQTNPRDLQNRSMLRIVMDVGPRNMYAGWSTTLCRNALGSFLLFGGTAVAKEYVFHLEDYRSATFAQNIAASTLGASLAVVATSPLDVIKTRIQHKCFGHHTTAAQVLTRLLKVEGAQALFKGITPKVVTTAPRLVFSYTLSQHFTVLLRRYSSAVQSSKLQNNTSTVN